MNIVTEIKARLLRATDENDIKRMEKRQFNITIERDIIGGVRYLASRFGVPLAPMAAHMLQIGTHYLETVLGDTRKQRIVTEHIVDTHLLGIGAVDDPAILVIGEKGDYWQMLEQSKHVLRCYQKYSQAPRLTERTGDIRHMEKAQKALLKSVVGFSIWLQKQSLDPERDEKTEQT